MGLTADSMGLKVVDMGFVVKKISDKDCVVALAGNPNVGKSTVFNALTGLKQHTGNWPGKTVSNAQGVCYHNKKNYIMVDIPGTYSLMAHSQEEEVARDFICFANPDAVVVVCDATCIERNLNLVLQIIEITNKVVVCLNLMDEAKRKEIKIDVNAISNKLGVPVVRASAKSGRGLNHLMNAVEGVLVEESNKESLQIQYSDIIENAIDEVVKVINEKARDSRINPRWIALRILENDEKLITNICDIVDIDIINDEVLVKAISKARAILDENNISINDLKDEIVRSIVRTAEDICSDTVIFQNKNYNQFDRKIDRILTNKLTGTPIMIILLAVVFWLTIIGANYPSRLLSSGLFWIEDKMVQFCIWARIPEIIYGALIYGVYHVLAWVVSVMLPPMAIFFPLFTLLEDLGYLPRVAFNLDKTFKKCCACGKQALTMCMGFGCNAAGIIGCRIIDSPRERLIAIITNNFVPCNGRFPTLISIITMFFIFSVVVPLQSLVGAMLLTLVILLGVFMTFVVSKLLSKTLLKGQPSSFTLELPPYRKPRIGQIVLHSIFDRTLFVLGRAVSVAAPAGLVIWLFANIQVGGSTLLIHCSTFLDPFAKMLGMDGTILFAFILGFPANEIVVPIIIMAYMSTDKILEMYNLISLKQLLVDNGWTWVTAISTMLFSLMHWPCSTTMLTIKRETGSLKWTALSFIIPTVIGIAICFCFASVARLFI